MNFKVIFIVYLILIILIVINRPSLFFSPEGQIKTFGLRITDQTTLFPFEGTLYLSLVVAYGLLIYWGK